MKDYGYILNKDGSLKYQQLTEREVKQKCSFIFGKSNAEKADESKED